MQPQVTTPFNFPSSSSIYSTLPYFTLPLYRYISHNNNMVQSSFTIHPLPFIRPLSNNSIRRKNHQPSLTPSSAPRGEYRLYRPVSPCWSISWPLPSIFLTSPRRLFASAMVSKVLHLPTAQGLPFGTLIAILLEFPMTASQQPLILTHCLCHLMHIPYLDSPTIPLSSSPKH